jgi:DNA-binding NarL/FixJ family response regulator
VSKGQVSQIPQAANEVRVGEPSASGQVSQMQHPTSTRFLAGILGYSKSTIHRDCGNDNATVRGRDGKVYPSNRRAHFDTVTFALHALDAGKTTTEIADALGVSRRTVRRWNHMWRV